MIVFMDEKIIIKKIKYEKIHGESWKMKEAK